MNEIKKIDNFFTKITIGIFIVFVSFLAIPVVCRVYVKVFDKSNSFIDFVFKDNPDVLPTNIESNIESSNDNENSSVKENVENKESTENNKIDESYEISWLELYPFEQKGKENNNDLIFEEPTSKVQDITTNKDKNKNSILNMAKRLLVSFYTIQQKITDWINVCYFDKQKIIQIATKVEYILKWNLQPKQQNTYSSFEILPNGHFTQLVGKNNVKHLANSVIEYNNFLREQGTKLFYVCAPYKYSSSENYGKKFCYVKENADDFIDSLSRFDIPVLNLRQEINNEQKNFYDCFYKTDHHWTAETGFWATKKIVEFLKNNSNVKIDNSLYDVKNYQYKIYKNGYLGSYGRRATLSLATPDDFTLITPNFKTDFTVNFSSTKKTDTYLTGDILDTIYAKDWLPLENTYSEGAYGAYSHGDTNRFIQNNLAKNDYKILMTSDSFSDVVIPFLSLGIKQLDTFDLRYFDGSLRKFIEKNGPYDAVIILLNEGQLVSSEKEIKSHNCHWNFE